MIINKKSLLKKMIKYKIIKSGHFLLTSGNHSKYYVDKDRILLHGDLRSAIVDFLYWKSLKIIDSIDVVVSPGIAGISWGSAVSKDLNVPFIYTEKQNGQMVLRKSFKNIIKNKNVLIIEDIVSTGSSIKKIIDILKFCDVNKIYCIAIWNRSHLIHVDAIFNFKIPNWKPAECQMCKKNIPLIDPKSDEMVNINRYHTNGINIKVKDDDLIFMWDIDKSGDKYPIPYLSKIFNGTFEEFKKSNFGNKCRNVGLRITREWETKIDIKLKFQNNQFSFLDNHAKEVLTLNLKEM